MRVYIVIHNNLSNLRGGVVKVWLWRLVLGLPSVTVLTLTTKQAEVVKRLFPEADADLLPHPTYSHLSTVRSRVGMPGSAVHLALMGRHARMFARGGDRVDDFIRCCSLAAQQVDRNVVISVYCAAGSVPQDSRVKVVYRHSPVGSAEYFDAIASASYVVLWNLEDELRPSGILADCLTVGTPFIAFKRGHVLDLSAAGDGGGRMFWLGECRDTAVLAEAFGVSTEEYAAMVRANIELANRFSLERTTSRLRQIFERGRSSSVAAGIV